MNATCNLRIRMSNMRAQATIEFILMLGVGLLIALLAFGLYDGLSDVGTSMQSKQYRDYWEDQARPFVVSDFFYKKNATRFYVALTLIDDEKFNLSAVYINDTQVSYYIYNSSLGGDGVGTLKCPYDDCMYMNCSCSYVVSPKTTVAIVTQEFLSSSYLCGIRGEKGWATLKFYYNRPENRSRTFIETSFQPIPFDCIP